MTAASSSWRIGEGSPATLVRACKWVCHTAAQVRSSRVLAALLVCLVGCWWSRGEESRRALLLCLLVDKTPPTTTHYHDHQVILRTAMSIADEGVQALDPPRPFPPPYLDEEEADGLINYPGAWPPRVGLGGVGGWVLMINRPTHRQQRPTNPPHHHHHHHH